LGKVSFIEKKDAGKGINHFVRRDRRFVYMVDSWVVKGMRVIWEKRRRLGGCPVESLRQSRKCSYERAGRKGGIGLRLMFKGIGGR